MRTWLSALYWKVRFRGIEVMAFGSLKLGSHAWSWTIYVQFIAKSSSLHSLMSSRDASSFIFTPAVGTRCFLFGVFSFGSRCFGSPFALLVSSKEKVKCVFKHTHISSQVSNHATHALHNTIYVCVTIQGSIC